VPGWLDAGFVIANLGGLILAVSLVVGGVGVYRLREGRGAGLLKATLVLALILLVAYVVAAWAMAGKPD
jgi:cation transporter-like permease